MADETKKKVEGRSEEEVEETDTEDETVDESEEESEEDDKSEDEKSDDDSSSTDDKELDLDAELAAERKLGEPDTTIAKKAFKDRKTKRDETDEEEDDDQSRPLTRADLDAHDAKIRKEMQQERALELAKEMAGSDKEAELIVAKWSNRTFPKSLTLKQQISEAYVITHSKKLIGERNEAMRALKGKQGVQTKVTTTHRDAQRGAANEPKMPPADAAAIRASGFIWNTTSRRHEKKLSDGRLLIRDPKTKQVRLERKR